jgi:hypothetical protein
LLLIAIEDFLHIQAASNMPARKRKTARCNFDTSVPIFQSIDYLPDFYEDRGIRAKNGTTLAIHVRFIIAICERI